MKKILFLLSVMFLLSCVKVTQSEPITVQSTIFNKEHTDRTNEWTYHYGYSFTNGKFCMHYGPEDKPEKNIVKFVFLGDTLQRDSKTLFNKTSLCPGTFPDIEITYVKVYHDSIFYDNQIIEIH